MSFSVPVPYSFYHYCSVVKLKDRDGDVLLKQACERACNEELFFEICVGLPYIVRTQILVVSCILLRLPRTPGDWQSDMLKQDTQ